VKEPGPTEPQPGQPKPLPSAAAFLGMGLSAAVCVGIGVVLGLWADSAWHTSPALLLVGMAVGLTVAVVMVITQIREYL
jgi:1,4-dihydroxy-2-naphthoate octaprenyltransferase